MGRLIDADAEIIRIMEISDKHSGVSGSKIFSALDVVRILEQAPTAYDVDKVVERIEKISVYRSEYSEIVDCNIEIFGHCCGSCYECILNCATDIVKGAVKE